MELPDQQNSGHRDHRGAESGCASVDALEQAV
jgi:hypothetical protein